MFNDVFKQKREDIEKIILTYLPKAEGRTQVIMDAMKYSVLAGGKRLRPLLLSETYALFGGEDSVVEPYMAAIEFIHSYSLVHDDLPALDNDELRRGKPTTHKVYGEDMAILTGDALLNYAFEVMSGAYEIDSRYLERCARATHYVAKKSGIYGMIGGQVVDVQLNGEKLDLDTILYIHANKTSALIQAAMVSGAILAGAKEDEIQAVEEVANKIGLAFQIQDDILDIEGDEKKLGKKIHSDEKNNKSTYVTIKGLEQAKIDVASISESAMEQLKDLGYSNEFLFELIDYLITRDY